MVLWEPMSVSMVIAAALNDRGDDVMEPTPGAIVLDYLLQSPDPVRVPKPPGKSIYYDHAYPDHEYGLINHDAFRANR